MQNVSTKERIIDSALTLFSENGIESTSVEQIASSVGVKAPALYKHFKSKQEIVDSIFLMIFERYNAKIETEQREIESCLSSFDSYADKAEKAAELVGNALKSVFAASIQDDFLNRASRLSQIERFHFDRFASLYQNEFHDHLMNPSKNLLHKLMERNVLKNEDLEVMTAQFVSPLILLFDSCRSNMTEHKYALDFVTRHVRQFFRIYKK